MMIRLKTMLELCHKTNATPRGKRVMQKKMRKKNDHGAVLFAIFSESRVV